MAAPLCIIFFFLTSFSGSFPVLPPSELQSGSAELNSVYSLLSADHFSQAQTTFQSLKMDSAASLYYRAALALAQHDFTLADRLERLLQFQNPRMAHEHLKVLRNALELIQKVRESEGYTSSLGRLREISDPAVQTYIAHQLAKRPANTPDSSYLTGLRIAVQVLPREPEILSLAVQTAIDLNQWTLALPWLDNLRLIHPSAQTEFLWLQALWHNHRQDILPTAIENFRVRYPHEAARQNLEAFLKPRTDPKEPDSTISSAWKAHYEAGRYQLILQNLSPQALDHSIAEKDCPWLIQSLLKTQSTTQASTVLTACLIRFPENRQLENLQLQILALQFPQAALKEIQGTSSQDPARLILAQIYLNSKRPQEAITLLTDLLESPYTDLAQTYELLAEGYSKIGYYARALQYLENAERMAPRKISILFRMALNYRMLGQQELLKAVAEKAALKFPGSDLLKRFEPLAPGFLSGADFSPMTTLPISYRLHEWLKNPEESQDHPLEMLLALKQQKRYREYLTRMEIFLARQPLAWPELEAGLQTVYELSREPQPRYELEDARLEKLLEEKLLQNKAGEVLSFFQSLPSSITPYPALKFILARSYLATGRIREGEETLEELLSLGFLPVQIRAELAQAAYEQGSYDKALELYTEILGMNPEPSILFKIAEVLTALGSYPQARQIYENLLNHQTDPEIVRNATWSLKALNATEKN